MTAWAADGDPVLPDIFDRLDAVDTGERCGPPDPRSFQLLPRRYLVAFDPQPDDDLLAQLGEVARVRWLYRQLGLAEVDADDAVPIAAVPGVGRVVPAWNTVGSTRALAVALDALCSFAAKQAHDQCAVYRHNVDIGYPIVVRQKVGRSELDLDASVRLATPPALIPVVNMSLGTTTVGFPTAANDIVNLATGAASQQMLVVVAAGNCGTQTKDSMSAWARPDWVLSVGATDDAEGTRIAEYSSHGTPGPDLVAEGRSRLDPKKVGTSFAAPRVTNLARFVVAAFCQLGPAVLLAQGAADVGVPAVGYGIVDCFDNEIWWQPTDAALEFLALPLLGTRTEQIDELVRLTDFRLTVRATPRLVREVLLAAARPLPGSDPSRAGAGFVDGDIVVDHLVGITGADLWQWFGTGPMPDPVRLAKIRPFDAATLNDLGSVINSTGPVVKFDFLTGRCAALPQPDGRLAADNPRAYRSTLRGSVSDPAPPRSVR